jgi:hypothetical protein
MSVSKDEALERQHPYKLTEEKNVQMFRKKMTENIGSPTHTHPTQ